MHRAVRSKASSLVAASAIACAGALSAQEPQQDTGVGVPPPADSHSCARRIAYLYERTFLKLDILEVAIEVDSATARTVVALVSAEQRPAGAASLEDAIAQSYRNARHSAIDLVFLRNIRADQFIGGKWDNLGDLAAEGVLDTAEAETLTAEFASDFAFLEAEGIRDGDRLDYRVDGDTVQAAYVGAAGDTLGTLERVGDHQRDAILGAYFADSSDFREGLVKTVLECLSRARADRRR